MGDKIQFINENFDFNTLNLAQPNGLQGGAYFTKLSSNDEPLYLQITKCNTKQGIVKTAKKTYCDLMFSDDNTVIVNWFENLEKRLIDLIYEKKDIWFHTPLDKEDIESQFTSPIRIYKSGKYYLVRVNIAHANILKPGDFNCYNEEGYSVDPNTLDDQSLEVIPLIEIQGVKFSSRSFSCEIALKQLMLLKKDHETFNKCLITNPKSNQHQEQDKELDKIKLVVEEREQDKEQDKEQDNELDKEQDKEQDNELDKEQDKEQDNELDKEQDKELDKEQDKEQDKIKLVVEEREQDNKTDDVESYSMNSNLEELEIDLDNLDNDYMKLRQPNEVYTEIWREARKRAKNSRRATIEAYLEAKNIKATYMISEIDNDSEDEFDEIIKNINLNKNIVNNLI